MKHHSIINLIFLSVAGLLLADVKLPAIIGDNMVLQQDADVKLWGWAGPGEKIVIEPGWNREAGPAGPEVTADESGKWSAFVNTPTAGGPYGLTIKGSNSIELKNILIGEVWLCSGQSNMQMPMKGWGNQQVDGSAEDIKQSTNSSIRLFTVQLVAADAPAEDVVGSWVECSPETAADFSAVGYYFGRKIHRETGCPVGLINSSWGGTSAQAWTRVDFIKHDDNLSPVIGVYDAKVKAWQEACAVAEKEQKPKPERTWGFFPQDKPGSLYNGMIAPITNMTIKGAIWYQGESNAGASYLYRDLFPTMIKNWRCDFNHFDMPFYFVQLAAFTNHQPGEALEPYRGQPREHGWAELREAQLMTNSMEHTGMAVTIDIGETNNIHPGNKKDVGERLAFWALANDYGKEIDYSGPLYAGYKIEGDKIRIIFNYAEDGLMFKDGAAKGFAIAAADKMFVWADARIEGATVVVFSENVKEPAAVRYAWDTDPESCLYNKANLPASPFRTDDWNGITCGNK